MADGGTRRAGPLVDVPAPGEGGWREHSGNAYRVPVFLGSEGGRYQAAVANLPGVTGEGATQEEALASIKAAASRAIAGYKEAGQPIPWTEQAQPPPGKQLYWVVCYTG